MPDGPKKSLETRVVHGDGARDFAYDAVTQPLVQTATYAFRDTAELVAYMEGGKDREEYGRYGNPTVTELEARLAAVEGTEEALVFASGMAAVTTSILALTKAGAHVVLFADCYRRTRQFVTQILSRFGVTHTLVPAADLGALAAALRPETRLVVSEAPTNPYLYVVDVPAMVALCKARGVKTLIDATFATPFNYRPAEDGVDLVLHSATKYLAGHNDVLGGVVAGKAGLLSLVREARDVLGGIADPHAAWLIGRGLKTLALRVARQNASALALARALEGHPRVERVFYPGLASHPHHEVAARLMRGHGGVVSFVLRGDLARTSRFVDALRMPRIAPSLGGTESLVEQPALMSFYELSPEQREAVGIRDSLVRYSVGIEDTDELVADVLAALERSA